jgi:hypothetical protein
VVRDELISFKDCRGKVITRTFLMNVRYKDIIHAILEEPQFSRAQSMQLS